VAEETAYNQWKYALYNKIGGTEDIFVNNS
jgi:hypothetical protein